VISGRVFAKSFNKGPVQRCRLKMQRALRKGCGVGGAPVSEARCEICSITF